MEAHDSRYLIFEDFQSLHLLTLELILTGLLKFFSIVVSGGLQLVGLPEYIGLQELSSFAAKDVVCVSIQLEYGLIHEVVQELVV